MYFACSLCLLPKQFLIWGKSDCDQGSICMRSSWEGKRTCHISPSRACSHQEQGRCQQRPWPSPGVAAALRTFFLWAHFPGSPGTGCSLGSGGLAVTSAASRRPPPSARGAPVKTRVPSPPQVCEACLQDEGLLSARGENQGARANCYKTHFLEGSRRRRGGGPAVRLGQHFPRGAEQDST